MKQIEGSFQHLLLLFTFIGYSAISSAQCPPACGPSVVNNSSFELTSADCGTANSEIFTDYSQVQGWMGTACLTCPGNGSTPDYYNSACTGAAPTENCGLGTGSVGFFTSVEVGGTGGSNSREYVQTQLNTTLVAGQEYCATIQVKTSPASFSYVPSDGLGLWFTTNMVDIDLDNGGQQYLGPGSIVNATPQIANASGNIIDTICTTITGTFIATGNEDWLVMGNFRPDNVMQTTAACGGFFSFCFGYLIVDQLEVIPVCTSCDATVAASGPFCLSDSPINISSTNPGGTWAGNGVTDINAGTFDPSTAGIGTHQIIYSLTCGDADTILITVDALNDASFSYAATSFCLNDSDPLPTITGLSGGTFSIDNGGTVNASNGQIDLATSGNGSYTISYFTNGQCPTSQLLAIDILLNSDASINTTGPFCETDSPINLTAADAGGTWSGNGITDINLGTFDPSAAGVGTHAISYTILGTCGDNDLLNITVNSADDASFNYSLSNYCIAGADPSPNVTGLAGGTFSIDGSGLINASSGIIDLNASGTGNFIVTYSTNGPCPETAIFSLSILNTLDATIDITGPFCENDLSISLSAASGGGTWSGTGITDANLGSFSPSIAGVGNHQIYYSITGACGDIDSIEITIQASDIASFTYSSSTYCTTDTNPLASITGTMGGSFSISNAGTINPTNGEIDLINSGAGTFTVTYLTAGFCPDTAQFVISITNGGLVSINPAGPFCLDAGQSTLSTAAAGGSWSGNGITDPNLGTFDPQVAGIGIHQIVYTVAGNCGGSDTILIDVLDQVSISLPSAYVINYGNSAMLAPSYFGSGIFSWSPADDLDCPDCAIVLANPSSTSTYCVTYSNGTCQDTACTLITVDYNCGEVVVPTAFTPNSGNENSLECVLGTCVVQMNFKIYDRWGELVFESNDQGTCWDGNHMRNGKEMSTGVYVYQIDAQLIDGTNMSAKGNITLIR